MKLLVLAQIPPPLQGQTAMVKVLVDGLPAHGIGVHHINLKLSEHPSDIGRWQLSKIFATIGFALKAIRARFAQHCDTLYYVPTGPGARGALYRDWVLLFLCRPFFPRCVLHWHASGLGVWLATDGNLFERGLSRILLGRAHLSIVLAHGLQADAECFRPRRVAAVPNGIPIPPAVSPPVSNHPFRLLFLGLCSEQRGLFSAASAVMEANRRTGAHQTNPTFVLTAAGPFDNRDVADRFQRLCAEHPSVFRHAGTVSESQKTQLFAESNALIFPTRYLPEGMPLVAIEALAHDRPVIATNRRALPDIITPDVGILVPASNEAALAAALLQIRQRPPAPRACRARFLAHFTLERHLVSVAEALSALTRSKKG